jgi:hypothetical protein
MAEIRITAAMAMAVVAVVATSVTPLLVCMVSRGKLMGKAHY